MQGLFATLWGSALCGLLIICTPAAAVELEIEEPEVEKGEIEFEYRGGWFTGRPAPGPMTDDDDDDAPRAGEIENEVVRQQHEVEVEIGLTEWLQFQAGAEFEQERNDEGTSFNSLKLSEIEFAALLEILPVERRGLGATLYLGLEETVAEGEEGTALIIGPLVKAVSGPLSATGNFYFARVLDEVEKEIEDGEAVRKVTPDYWTFAYATQVRYMAGGWFGFGVEAFGEVPDVGGNVANTMLGRDPRQHLIGPTLYLTLGEDGEGDGGNETGLGEPEGPSLQATLGLLFGLTDDTSDLTLKWDAEIEF